jgi:hypothetical protein
VQWCSTSLIRPRPGQKKNKLKIGRIFLSHRSGTGKRDGREDTKERERGRVIERYECKWHEGETRVDREGKRGKWESPELVVFLKKHYVVVPSYQARAWFN